MAEDLALWEGILWEPPAGYFLLERHLRRLGHSAAHFRFRVDVEAVRNRLLEFAVDLPERPRKVRLEVSSDGAILLEDVDLKPSTPVRVALAVEPVDSKDELLRHKTSRRGVYERALAARPEAQDVLLWNERRELTETCSANLVLESGGQLAGTGSRQGWEAGLLRHPSDIAMLVDGRVVVADQGNGRIQIFRPVD